MFEKLDWSTPTAKIGLSGHWRIFLCILVAALLAMFVWHACFPNTFWFVKLWAGFATGSLSGVITGTWWQLRDCERHPKTSGRLLAFAAFAWGVLSLISLGLLAPDLYAQERERTIIRSLTLNDISAIAVSLDGQTPYRFNETKKLDLFVNCAGNADLFYPNHEESTSEFEIAIYLTDGSLLQYDGRIPERHQSDFAIDFRDFFAKTEIIFPNGRKWLNLPSDDSAR